MNETQSALPGAFHRLWAADAFSTAGDGFTLVAAPLLMTTLTDNPTLITGAAAAAQLPWLIFGLPAGAVVDRSDQRRLLIKVDVIRALLLTVLAVAIATGRASVPLIYVLLFASGAGDTLVRTAGSSLVARLVDRSQLTRANSRLAATRLIGGALVARPIGAFLFTAGRATPFAVDAASFLIGVALLVGLPVRPPATDSPLADPLLADPSAPDPSAADYAVANSAADRRRGQVRQGLRILWADRVLRTLALSILVMNITLSGTMAVLVIYSRTVLGLSPTGYGVLLANLAVGGLIGTVLVTPLLRRFGASALLKFGLLIEAATHLTFAVTSSAWVAGSALLIFGIHDGVWSVLTVSLRQHRTAQDVRGRVNSAYLVLAVGGAALGALSGGVLVSLGGIRTPMWCGTIAVLAVFAVAVPTLRASEVELETSPKRG